MKRLNLESILSKAAIFFFLLFLSCSKSIVSNRQVTDLSGLESKVIKRQQFISSNDLKIKFKSVVEIDGKENKVTGRIFVLSDTCIFLNIMSSALGIEVGQMLMTPDSVIVLNKIEKNYYSGKYSDFKNIFVGDFNFFYSLFTSTYLGIDTIMLNNSNVNYVSDMQRFIVSDMTIKNDCNLYLTTIFDRYGNVWRTDYKNCDGNFFRVNYSNFALNYGFPVELNLTSTINGKKSELTIFYENVSFAKDFHFPDIRTALKKYKRVTL